MRKRCSSNSQSSKKSTGFDAIYPYHLKQLSPNCLNEGKLPPGIQGSKYYRFFKMRAETCFVVIDNYLFHLYNLIYRVHFLISGNYLTYNHYKKGKVKEQNPVLMEELVCYVFCTRSPTELFINVFNIGQKIAEHYRQLPNIQHGLRRCFATMHADFHIKRSNRNEHETMRKVLRMLH